MKKKRQYNLIQTCVFSNEMVHPLKLNKVIYQGCVESSNTVLTVLLNVRSFCTALQKLIMFFSKKSSIHAAKIYMYR